MLASGAITGKTDTMSDIMIAHIGAGTIAVLAGATALFARKGSRLHRAAGNAFFVSMLIASGVGAYAAFTKPEMITFLAGVFTCYLVATAWMTVMRPEGGERGGAGLFDGAGLVAALAIGGGGILFGLEAQNNAAGLKDGYSAEPYFFFGGLALFAALLDASVILRRGVAGRQRIARHLWRMSFALYIAAGSLFTGPGSKAFPEFLKGSPILSAPETIVMVLMVFWLARVLLTKWADKAALRSAPGA